MFGNLKSKLGDVADLKKLSSPVTLVGQRSRQQTPGTITPNTLQHHSRHSSVASLQGLGSPTSPPLSPNDHDRLHNYQEREQDLEREIEKLRTALETQQDAALERLNHKEQEWRARLQHERENTNTLQQNLEQATDKEKKLQEKLLSLNSSKKQAQDQLKQAQGLEVRVCEMQDNNDQLEGLNAQEVAKIKHMLLNTNNELEEARAELNQKSEALSSTEARLSWAAGLEDRVARLGEEKTELETQVAGLTHKLSQAMARHNALESGHEEEVEHLRGRVSTLEQRHSQAALQETDKVQALIKEREGMEHSLEEARQQLNNIKASWSDKITALENQISHLNDKMAEDQGDLQAAEERNQALTSEVNSVKEEMASIEAKKEAVERALLADISQLKEDLETANWQLNSTVTEKDQQIQSLQQKLSIEEEKHQSCASVLQCKLETLATLEQRMIEVESEVATTKSQLAEVQESLLRAQSDKKHLQETLHQERTALEASEKGKSEYQAKLEVVSGEKARLSRNLDEYADKVTKLETGVEELQTENDRKTNIMSELETRLSISEGECQELRDKMNCSEDGLALRIEESEVVSTLRNSVKALEDELSEKKQALKVQGTRLADMKKTIQRELKLTPDTSDMMVSAATTTTTVSPLPPQPPLPVNIASFTTGSMEMLPDSRLTDSFLAANGSAMYTGNENGNNVNLAYLKHVIIKYLTSREYEAVHLTRAVATLLMMSPEEERLLSETLQWKMSWFGSKPNLGKGQGALSIPPSH